MSWDVALYDPSGAEISAAGYSRQSTLPSDWSTGHNGVAITFGPAGADWGQIASTKVWNGTALEGSGPVADVLGFPVTVAPGASLTFVIGSIVFASAVLENVAF